MPFCHSLHVDIYFAQGDFSENFSPNIQDQIQSYHWSKGNVQTLFTLGGCLKRAVARANLTTIVRGHIITPRQFFEYCSEHVQGITLMWCSEEEINLLAEQKLLARYAKAKTVPGTLGYHQFSVVRGTSKVVARIMSGDEMFFTHNTCKA